MYTALVTELLYTPYRTCYMRLSNVFLALRRDMFTQIYNTTNEAISTPSYSESLNGFYLEYLDFTFAPGYRLARFSLYFFVSPDNLRDISQKSRLLLSTSSKNASGCC